MLILFRRKQQKTIQRKILFKLRRRDIQQHQKGKYRTYTQLFGRWPRYKKKDMSELNVRILNWPNEGVIETSVPLLYLHGVFEQGGANEEEGQRNLGTSSIPDFVTCGSQQWPVVDAHFKV